MAYISILQLTVVFTEPFTVDVTLIECLKNASVTPNECQKNTNVTPNGCQKNNNVMFVGCSELQGFELFVSFLEGKG